MALAGLAWAAACGDGATDPPPPGPTTPDPPRATTVVVSPATARLTALGATAQLSAQVRDQNGQAMTGTTVTWATNAAAVATVAATGLVTATGNGTATITATAGGVSGSATVTVAQEVTTVAVSPVTDTLVAGDTTRLAAEATDANGHPVQGGKFTWASGDTAVVVVDETGLVTAVAAGEVEVTATASGVVGRASLVVVAPAPTTVAVTPEAVALAALGDTVRLMAETRDQLGRVMDGVVVGWASGDTLVATVDSTGLVTAAGNGTATITATAGTTFGTAVVSVMQSAGSVIVSPRADTIAPGGTLRLAAEAFDENGQLVAEAVFTWSSSHNAVATVDATGLVRGLAEGVATITATSGDARGTSDITVHNPDRVALEALYHATDGPNWVNSDNWLTDAPLGEWYGVNTNASGRVVRLDLGGEWDNGWVPHGLRGPIPPEPTSLSELTVLSLHHNELAGPFPPELGNLARLEELYLSANRLSGPIPPELGILSRMRDLQLSQNTLTGPIPGSLLQLGSLQYFGFERNNGLCAPGNARFVAWLEALLRWRGPLCSDSDKQVLELLFESAGGSAWTNSTGWLETPLLTEWHGVTADSLGRVVTLDLSGKMA